MGALVGGPFSLLTSNQPCVSGTGCWQNGLSYPDEAGVQKDAAPIIWFMKRSSCRTMPSGSGRKAMPS
jgi:dienelactone hydrolase